MSPSHSHRHARAFTLIELTIALLVLAALAASLAVPIATQVQLRRQEETRRLLDDAKDALLGFVAAHARLPCPATASSNGMEGFAAGGSAANGDCADFHGGYLPGASLGLAPLDPEGFVRDPWQGPQSRVRYAVYGAGSAINGVVNPLTRANGMQAATLAGLGAAPSYLFICTTGAAANASGCGPAANQLTRRAAFVLLSLGPNASATPPAGSDEARNVDGDAVFVYREASGVAGREYDDQLQWVPIHLVVNRMVLAGRLP
jgi:prepilin-type N-terminal cleavage/methylation domain-containing protein